jgi:aspartate dehydrogenase
MHLGLIGYGNISGALVRLLRDRAGGRVTALTVLARPVSAAAVQVAAARDFGRAVAVVTDARALIAARPALVVEAAGHAAVRDAALPCLAAGIEVVIVSVGALADAGLEAAVAQAARQGGTRAVLPAGAVGGIDLLAALRLGGLSRVTYTSRKSPGAWAGTPAEALLDLGTLTTPTEFFDGTARQADTDYPKNANVAATVALAGAGWEATAVRMIADPGVTRNIHEISVQAVAGDFDIRIAGNPSPDNPKTSAATALSAAREVLNRLNEVAL